MQRWRVQTVSRCWSQASCSTACPWCWRSGRLARVSAPPSARWCPLPRCPPSPEPQCPHCPGSAGPWPPRRWWRRCCAGAARRSWPRPPPGACCGWRGRWTACRASCGCWVTSQRHNNVTSRPRGLTPGTLYISQISNRIDEKLLVDTLNQLKIYESVKTFISFR